jgi:glucose/arabinose dehydrogenase
VAPDGRVFLIGPAGNAQIWDRSRALSDPTTVFEDVATRTDGGLIDLVLHPTFSENHQTFFAYTARMANGGFVNRVVRSRETDGAFGDKAVMLEDFATRAPVHGPRIRFGPDGKLYVAFGSPGDPAAASDPSSYQGKILRLNVDGTTPDDNPGFSPIISSGHRSPVAFDWQRETGQFWIGERDWSNREVLWTLERVRRGVRFSSSFQFFSKPHFALESPIDPRAAVFYTNGPTVGFARQLFMAGREGEYLLRVKFDLADPSRVLGTERLLEHEFGRLGDLVGGPDGALYFLTSNRSTNRLSQADERLVRIK